MPTNAECIAFIEIASPVIQKYAKQYGYKVASPIIAQACCESKYGQSGLATKAYNYFGLKCGNNWNGASINMKTGEEYQVGVHTTISANFRKYPTFEDGIKGYFEFISKSRYANLKTATDPKTYLEMIKADGYATSSTYVQTNMNLVNKWNLTRFDNFVEKICPYPIPSKTLKQGSKGDEVKFVQFVCKICDQDLGKYGIDGDFGTKTKNGVVAIQTFCGLKPTGIVDEETTELLKNILVKEKGYTIK